MNGYLTKAELAKLDAILKTVPWLAHRLDETILRQDRIGGAPIPSLGGNDSTEQPLPYNHIASNVRDQLHNTLVSWTRHVLEQRGMYYQGDTSTAGTSRWLRAHIDALALTEGSAEALPDIDAATRSAWRVIDRPEERLRPIDAEQVEEASETLLNANGIEKLARELGEQYRNLSFRRVLRLRDAGVIEPCKQVSGLDLYKVGDVLAAHLSYPSRRRRVS